MRTLMFFVAVLLLMANFATAADVSGKWRGSAAFKTPDGQSMTVPISSEFKQQDKTVTGTTGKDGEEQYTIEKGTIEGNKVTFQFTAPEEDEPSGKRTYTLRLNVISDTQLDGEFDFMMNDAKMTGKVMLARAK